MVSGVSAGALIAPLAFLGRGYDPQLRSLFTETDTKDVMRPKGLFSALFGSSYADSKPLADLIARVVTPAFLNAIAREHGRGRQLFVVTTNLDAQRAVLWDLGAIAASASPRRIALFRSVLLASASLPGVFPPVLIEARAAGRVIREMHADGGATAQILALPEAFVARGTDVGARRLDLYMIVNGRVAPSFELTRGRTVSILERAMGSLLRSSTRGNLLETKTFADRRGYPLRVAAIGGDFVGEEPKPFDRAYMRRLFDYGYERGRVGTTWSTAVSDLLPSDSGPAPVPAPPGSTAPFQLRP